MLLVRDNAIPAGRGIRLEGVGAVIVVHLLLGAIVLSGLPKTVSIPRGAHEMLILLMPKRAEEKPPAKVLPRRTAMPPAFRYPNTAPVPQFAPSVPKGLVIPFFRCAPENLGKLSPEDQAKCGGFGFSPPDNNTVAGFRSRVLNPALREKELADRKAPARVDCTRTTSRVIQNMAQDNGVMVDTVCAAGKILHALRR